MKRLPWRLRGSRVDLRQVGIPDSVVVISETPTEGIDVLRSLDLQGVCTGMSFSKGDVNGRIELPGDPVWAADRSLEANIITAEGPISAWFWLVEIEDDEEPGRRFVWWGTQRDQDKAWAWNV
jgi:hypothetical protein